MSSAAPCAVPAATATTCRSGCAKPGTAGRCQPCPGRPTGCAPPGTTSPSSGTSPQASCGSAPQVMRTALIYCLLDAAPAITSGHLAAAMALWRYSLASVQWIFGSTGDPDLDKLAEAAQAAKLAGLTSTQIRDLFGRHKSSAEIKELTDRLLATGDYDVITEETGGRPVTLLIYKPGDQSDQGDEKPSGWPSVAFVALVASPGRNAAHDGRQA